MSAKEKIPKNILLFQYQLKKNMIMVKQSHTNQNLLIVADSCELNHQTLLITCLILTIRIEKHAWREKISNQNVIS